MNDDCIIGLMGVAQSGKDTVGRILVEDHGFTRIAFADALRDMLYALDPWVQVVSVDDEHGTDDDPRRLQDIVDCIGWEQAKVVYPEVRALLQRLGTEAGRNVLGQNIWVHTAQRKVQTDRLGNPLGRYVFTDVRFPNEAETVQQAGGELWRVQRKGFEPVNIHVSETALDAWVPDAVVLNDGSIDDLRADIARDLAAK